MYRKFLNARSPLRLLEKGLQGGLGRGNLGLVLAGHGVGKTSFLVGVALDELLRGGHVLHVSLGHTVGHVRAHYDTVFDALASSTHLEDVVQVRQDVDRKRSIRVYPREGFGVGKLRDAVKLQTEAGAPPALVVVEGFDLAAADPGDLVELRALARELDAEFWFSVACPGERVDDVPPGMDDALEHFSVILALEPRPDTVALRAIRDHDNPDVSALHVALDPRTLLLVRS
jgi:hypothetical protein